jgi:sarcosine oxidase, subunit alpha
MTAPGRDVPAWRGGDRDRGYRRCARHRGPGPLVDAAAQLGITVASRDERSPASGRTRFRQAHLRVAADEGGNAPQDRLRPAADGGRLDADGASLVSQSRGTLPGTRPQAPMCRTSPTRRSARRGLRRCTPRAVLAWRRVGLRRHRIGLSVRSPAPTLPVHSAVPHRDRSDQGLRRFPERRDRQGHEARGPRGLRSIEHVKRYTTNGMATDQGKTSNMNASGIAPTALGRR